MIRLLVLILTLWSGSPWAQTRIAWIGDSVTESAPGTGVAKDPPRVLCELLNGQSCTFTGEYTNATAASGDATINAGTTPGCGVEYAGALYTVRNLGDSGDTVTNEIAGRYCRQVVAGETVGCASGFDYDVIIFAGPLNDFRSGAGLPGTLDSSEGEDADWVWTGAGANSLSAMVDDACRIQGKRVIMLGITPYAGGVSGNVAGKLAKRVTLNGYMATAAAQDGVIAGTCPDLTYVNSDSYVDSTDGSPDADDGSVNAVRTVGLDGIHLNTAACADWAQAVKDIAFP